MAGHLAISIEWQLEFPGPAWPLFHRERRQSLRAAFLQPRALFQLLCLYQANPTTSASWEDPCACAWGDGRVGGEWLSRASVLARRLGARAGGPRDSGFLLWNQEDSAWRKAELVMFTLLGKRRDRRVS
jgi:hypothetical protein